MAVIVLIAGCSKQQSPTNVSNLKPVTGAFGYNLGDKATSEMDNFSPILVSNVPPFNKAFVYYTSDGRIFRIFGVGDAQEYDVQLYRTQLVSILNEKYGLRSKTGAEKLLNFPVPLAVTEGYYFGTTNRIAYLGITVLETNAYFWLDYNDPELVKIHDQEEQAKDKKNEDDKKAAILKGL